MGCRLLLDFERIIRYRDCPTDYLEVLEELHIPFILSPWHDKDINRQTGELKKAHKHGAFFFDSLKSYKQVSELIKNKLNGPAHVEVVQSPKGLFDYFTHAENKNKTQYDVNDIEVGCGFNLDKFLVEMNSDEFMHEVVDIINNSLANSYPSFHSPRKCLNFLFIHILQKLRRLLLLP